MNLSESKRLVERHNSASIRAVSGYVDASYRHQGVWTDTGPLNLRTSHLALDLQSDTYAHARGVADAIALRLKHTDLELHQSLMPKHNIAAIIFDTLEQLRAEVQADKKLLGLKNNLEIAFTDWQRDYIYKGLTENHAGLVIFTLIQVVRSNMLGIMPTREVTPIIEEPQYHVIPLISTPLAQLRKNIHDQAAYAQYSLEIGTIIAEYLDVDLDNEEIASRYKIPLPLNHVDPKTVSAGTKKGNKTTTIEDFPWQGYHAFTTSYDRITSGAKLYSKEQRTKLRAKLDKQISEQTFSLSRLALRLKHIFGLPERSGWDFAQDEGRIDARRLAQLVANPDYHSIFKREHQTPTCDLVVSFLIDNSGSMKNQRYESVAVLVDMYSRALELAGAKTEILGFTTNTWNGGKALQDWRKAGQPTNPGRLNEGLFIIYKDAETPWRRAKYSIASLMNTLHYREGIDGEALDWAAKRLARRNEKRKALILISDGAPMDSATANANNEIYLAQHLHEIANRIETRSNIELRAIGIDLDMSEFFQRSITLDLKGTLDKEAFGALETLYR